MRFKDKIVAITGGGSGIGRQTGIRFAEEGAKVAVLDVNEDATKRVAEELKGLGCESLGIKCDVSKVGEVKESFAEIEKKYGELDILFSNAGVVRSGNIEVVTDENWDLQIGVNLNGTFYTNREAVKRMIPKKYGKIINMSSIWGGVSEKGGSMPAFSASKAGIIGLTRAVALWAAKYNINVNAIAPGYVNTPIHSEDFKKHYPQIAKNTPIGRVGEADEIASAVLFLASEEAAFIVGQVISPNGGFVV